MQTVGAPLSPAHGCLDRKWKVTVEPNLLAATPLLFFFTRRNRAQKEFSKKLNKALTLRYISIPKHHRRGTASSME